MTSEFIKNYQFGSISLENETFYEDIILLGKSVIPNWWREKGHHISKEDLKYVLDYAPELLIIGTGNSGLMNVPLELTKNLNFEIISLPTQEAIQLYNQEIKGNRKIAGAFHLTC
ncbi:MAG: MTH938/NDUFAF3 family protein [Promethearchaeota archaeon]